MNTRTPDRPAAPAIAALHGAPGPQLDEALWFATTSLVPALLLWLRVYRQGQPELFRMSA